MTLAYTHLMWTLRNVDRIGLSIAFAVVFLFAGWLRLETLGGPALWLDEILNIEIIRDLDLNTYQWFLGFERENGPLYFGLHALSLRAPLPVESAFRLPEALAGIAAVVVMALLAFRVTESAATGLVAALLLASSPLHVHYSREGRPYALIVLATIVVTWLLVSTDGRRRRLLLPLVLLLTSAIAATAAPLLLAALIVTVVDASLHQRDDRDHFAIWAAIAAIAYQALLYGRFDQPRNAGFDMPLQHVGVEMLNSWAITSGKTGVISLLTLLMAAFALLGFVRMRNRRAAWILIAMTILLPAGTIGALMFRDHWYSIRYTIPGLVPFVLLTAAGLAEITRIIVTWTIQILNRPSTYQRAISGTLAILVAVFVSQSTFVEARTAPFKRADWRRIGSILAGHAADGEFVIAADGWSAVCLRFYLKEMGRSLDVRSAEGSLKVARDAIERRPAGWIVSGGYGVDRSIRSWACRFFLVASDDEENVRLHYAPGLATFLQRSATASERERFVKRFIMVHGGRLEMGSTEEHYFSVGWHGPEKDGDEVFRWSRAESSILVPVPAGSSTLRIKAAAFDWPGRTQTLTIFIGDRQLAEFPLTTTKAIYEAPLPFAATPSLLHLDLRFNWEVVPEGVISSSDVRPLAASFQWIEIAQKESSNIQSVSTSPPATPTLFVVDGQDKEPRGPCPEQCQGSIPWDETRLKTLLLVLGRDSDDTLGMEDRRRFADATVASLPSRDCLPDSRFVEALYPVLLSRAPDSVGMTFYLAGLRSEWTRQEVVCRLTRSEEFADLWLQR